MIVKILKYFKTSPRKDPEVNHSNDLCSASTHNFRGFARQFVTSEPFNATNQPNKEERISQKGLMVRRESKVPCMDSAPFHKKKGGEMLWHRYSVHTTWRGLSFKHTGAIVRILIRIKW